MAVGEELLRRKILHNVAEIAGDGEGAFRMFRVPRRLLPKLNEALRGRVCSPAGMELRFRMKSSSVRLRLRRMPEVGHPVFTSRTVVAAGIFRGDFQDSWLALEEGENELEIKPCPAETVKLLTSVVKNSPGEHRFSPELTRIVLPPFIELRLVDVDGVIEVPRPEDLPSCGCLVYGSSITQGAYTPLGSGTFPAVIGRELGVDVWNLGFGGGAFLEPELAEWIVSRRDWKFAVLELGANLFHLPPEEFRKKVRKFLTFFAADSERRRVFILDLLPNTGEIRGAELEKAAAFRRVVREESASADAAANGGKGLLLHLEYASLLPDVTGYSTDLLHPAAHAFETIGRGLAAQIRERLLAAGENLR